MNSSFFEVGSHVPDAANLEFCIQPQMTLIDPLASTSNPAGMAGVNLHA